MTDQVNKLLRNGIHVTLLGSAQKESKGVMKDVESGKYQLVFSTPESFYSGGRPCEAFLNMARDNKLSLLAVNEAHLITTWQSFR